MANSHEPHGAPQTIVAALAALSARETYRVHLNDLGKPGAQPVPRDDYERLRAASIGAT